MADLNYIETFKKARQQAQAKMSPASVSRKFTGRNEMQLCGQKNSGMTFGVFIADENGQPYRIIDGFRSFRIKKEIADQYGINNYELRICAPNQYTYSEGEKGEEEKSIILKLNKMLENIGANWGAWEGKIAQYPPQWYKHMLVQYMKVERKGDLNGHDIQGFEPGVKVLMSRSDAYYRKFEGFVNDQCMISGGEGFINEFVGRNITNRHTYYMIKACLPEGQKAYDFTLQGISHEVTITDEDLKIAHDLNKEVINVTQGGISVEELKKWMKVIADAYTSIKNGVQEVPVVTETVEVVPEVKATPEPTPAVGNDDSDPFL